MNPNHFDHVTALPDGLYVPYLNAGCAGPGGRSSATELRTDDAGRVLVTRHPFNSRDLMVGIDHNDRPVWISAAHLAHRNCDACEAIWEARGREYQAIAAEDHAMLFALTTLPTASGDHEVLILPADEIPESWYADDDNPESA